MCGSGLLGAVSSWFGSPWDTARSRCGHGPGGLDEVAGQAFWGEGEALGALEAVPREADCSEDHGGGQSAVMEGRCLDMRRSLQGRHEARSRWSAVDADVAGLGVRRRASRPRRRLGRHEGVCRRAFRGCQC